MIAPGSFPGKAYCAPNGIPYVDLWREINRIADNLERTPMGQVAVSDALTLELMGDLVKCDVGIWRGLCGGVGYTVYGAAALSWCRDAKLEYVWQDWEASEYVITPGALSERPAEFVNRSLMPREFALSRIAQAAGSSATAFCVMIAAAERPLEFYLPMNLLCTAHPSIRSFLMDRLARLAHPTSFETELRERLSCEGLRGLIE
ncbi:MAG: hypothetical protein Q4G26_06370 [Paracoccus sp. (in: a-proteobacteria)]|nr:hypothetical protein [Paracoccus sp. (in: a-proteobacteria)]